MNILSIPVVAMASISFYVGIYHLLIYFRRRQNRADLTFALLCFSIVFYDAFCAGLYNATSLLEGAQWQRAQFVVLAIFVFTFLWFVSDYTHQKPGSSIYLFSAFYLVAFIIQLVDRSDLTFLLNSPSIKHITLSHAHTYYEAALGPFTAVQSLMGVVASTYVLAMGIRYFRDGFKREAIPLILGIVFMYAAGVHDTLVSNGVYDAVYLIEYAYTAMILMTTYSLSNTVVDAAIAKEELRKSEERFRALVETTSDWVWEVDANFVYTYASPKIRDLLGYEPEEILGRKPCDLMPADEAERCSGIFKNTMLQKKPLESVENINRCKDGRLVILETSGIPLLDSDGKLLGYRGIDRDITERKRTEAQLQQEKSLSDAIINGLPGTFYLFDMQGKLIRWNKEYEKVSGHTAEELPAVGIVDAVVKEDKERILVAVQRTFTEGQASAEASIITKSGERVPYYFVAQRIQLGDQLYVAGTGIDVTERKKAEEVIRNERQRFQTILETIRVPMLISRLSDGTVVYANEAIAQSSQIPLDRLIGFKTSNFYANLDNREVVLESIRQHGQISDFEVQFQRADGSLYWVLLSCRVFDYEGETCVLSTYVDITERKLAEQALQATTEELDRYFTSSLDLLCIADTNGYFRRVNPEWETTLGYTVDELEGRQFLEFVHPEDMEATIAAISRLSDQQQVLNFENRYRCKDGSYRWIEWRSYPSEQIIYAVARDITKRKQMEEALRQSEEKFRLFVEQSSDGLVFTNEQGIILEWNQSQEQLTGLSREKSIGQPLWEVIRDLLPASRKTSEMIENMKQITLLALQAGRADFIDKPTEIKLLRHSGEEIVIQQIAFAIKTNQGYRLGLIARDITQIKQVEDELRESEERYRMLVEVSPTATWIARNDILTYANPAALQILGATDPGQVVGRPALDFIHPDYHPAVKERIAQMRGEGRVAPLLEEKYVRLDGSIVDVAVVAAPFTTSKGAIIQVFFQDITKRKRAEEALRKSEARHRALIESQIDLVSRYLPDTTLTFVNDAYCKFFGKSREELVGQSYMFMIVPEYRGQIAADTKRLAEENGTVTGEYLNYRYDGQERWIQWVVKCITDENNRVIELQAVGRDITQLKQAEAERERLIAELESKNAELERFTYTVSHDLKAPLITIRGFLGFVEQDAKAGNLERMKTDMQRISAATDKMQRLLDELLELSRVGRLINPPVNIAFGDLIRDALKLVEGRLRGKNVEIKIQDNLPVVFGDFQRLLEVLQNLIDNAVKFIGTQSKPIIEIGTQGEENRMPVFFVRDNGIGIAPEHHERVFGLFNKLNLGIEGTGVGLAIVKRIIEVHGGRIWVESEEGKGATFYFTLEMGTLE